MRVRLAVGSIVALLVGVMLLVPSGCGLFQTALDFDASPRSGQAPLSVQFSISSDPGPDPFWDFGDGATSTEANPVHVYENPGTYTVTLTTRGGLGGRKTTTKQGFISVSGGFGSGPYVHVTLRSEREGINAPIPADDGITAPIPSDTELQAFVALDAVRVGSQFDTDSVTSRTAGLQIQGYDLLVWRVMPAISSGSSFEFVIPEETYIRGICGGCGHDPDGEIKVEAGRRYTLRKQGNAIAVHDAGFYSDPNAISIRNMVVPYELVDVEFLKDGKPFATVPCGREDSITTMPSWPETGLASDSFLVVDLWCCMDDHDLREGDVVRSGIIPNLDTVLAPIPALGSHMTITLAKGDAIIDYGLDN